VIPQVFGHFGNLFLQHGICIDDPGNIIGTIDPGATDFNTTVADGTDGTYRVAAWRCPASRLRP
jgi:hypothetical protein